MKEENYSNYERRLHWDFFDLGLLLLRCVFGDFLSSFFEYENTHNLDDLYQESPHPSRNSEFSERLAFMERRQPDGLTSFLKRLQPKSLKCCLLHELTKCSLSCETKEKEKIEKFKEFFNRIITTKYSPSFQSFLCQLLSFDSASWPSGNSLLSHPFIKRQSAPLVTHKKANGAEEESRRQKNGAIFDISLEETVKLHRETLRPSGHFEEGKESLVYFEKVLLGLSVALENCEPLVSFDDSELASRAKTKGSGLNITRGSPETKRLAEEFGIMEDLVFSKLKDLYC